MGCSPYKEINESEIITQRKYSNNSCSTSNSIINTNNESTKTNFKQPLTILLPYQVESLCQISNSIIAIGTNNGSITLWNIKKQQKLFTLEGHNGSIKTMKLLSNGLLASGSGDCIIKLWNPLEKKFVRNLIGHSSWVNDLIELSDGRLVSASSDGCVNVWNMDTYAIESSFRDDGSKNCLVQIDHSTIAFNSNDSVKLYNIDKKTVISSFPGAFATTASLLYLNMEKILISGSDNGQIRAWDLKTNEKLFSIKTPESVIKLMIKVSDDIIAVSGGYYVKMWSVSNQAEIDVLNGHHKEIKALLVLNDKRIVSGSQDKTVKIWN